MAAGNPVYSPFTHRKLVPSLTLHPQTQVFTMSYGIPSVSGFIFKESVMEQTLSPSWEDPEDTSDEDMEAAVATSSATRGRQASLVLSKMLPSTSPRCPPPSPHLPQTNPSLPLSSDQTLFL